jgi:hypothetical protein
MTTTTTTTDSEATLDMSSLCIKLMNGFLSGKYTLRIGQYAPDTASLACPVTDEYRDDTNEWMEQFFGVTELVNMGIAIVNETLVCMNRQTAAMMRPLLGDACGAIFNAANVH